MATKTFITLETPFVNNPHRNDFHQCVRTDHPLLGRDYRGDRLEVESAIRKIVASNPSYGKEVLIFWVN